jgi:hypothetical protein
MRFFLDAWPLVGKADVAQSSNLPPLSVLLISGSLSNHWQSILSQEPNGKAF